MDDLVTWLRAQLDDDERVARAVAEQSWTLRTERDYPTPDQAFPDHTLWLGERPTGEVGFGDGEIRPSEAQHIARHDPARVLAEVDAKRRILDEHNDPMSDGRTLRPGGETVVCGTCLEFGLRDEHQPWPCNTLRLLALPFADRPGYREEWAPDAS